MALTELQLPVKANFYNDIKQIASEVSRYMTRWKLVSDFIADVDTGDLDAMAVAAGQVRTDLINFRDALAEIVSLYEGNSVTPTNNPTTVVDSVRGMIP